MGRIVCDPSLESRLNEISTQGHGSGLIIGSKVDDKYYGVFLAETPKEEEEEKNKTLDVSWMTEHAKQVIRLLPGEIFCSTKSKI